MSEVHVVLCGNPGVGKSTVGNTLVGTIMFRSGVAPVGGLTTVLQTEKVGNMKVSDTPGMDDIYRRQEAANEISRAISGAGNVKLIFVMTCEAGRIRPADILILRYIMDAIADSPGCSKELLANNYSVIVNKCEEEVMRLFAKQEARDELVNYLGRICPVSHVKFLPECSAARGKPNTLLPNRIDLRQFISESPTMNVRGNVNIDVDDWDAVFERMQTEIEELTRRLEEMSNGGSEFGTGAVLGAVVVGLASLLFGGGRE